MSVITIERKVLEKNDAIAQKNRKLFSDKGLFVLNFVNLSCLLSRVNP